jgi:RNase adaptor protein for sRNA GlmZ degradation
VELTASDESDPAESELTVAVGDGGGLHRLLIVLEERVRFELQYRQTGGERSIYSNENNRKH